MPDRAPQHSDDRRDEDLMLSYASGDAAAFDALYARHKGGVYRYLLRHCGNAGTADELFQDIWMNVIRVRATYAPSAKFATWLYTLAHHRVVDHWRAQGQAALLSIDDDDDDSVRNAAEALPGARGDEPEVRASNRELGTNLHAALRALPPSQRDAFLLQQESGLSLAEIAALQGVGVETVKSRLRYAIARLRMELADSTDDLRAARSGAVRPCDGQAGS
ncbi:MAG: RNA polymerase sigma factor [Casimicrobiaceae bacterium]